VTYLNDAYQQTVLELARQGNLRAIAYWINSHLAPQGVYARLDSIRSGCLQIQVELPKLPDLEKYPGAASERFSRFICHCLVQLNSEAIEGVRIATRFTGEVDHLWQRSIRIVTPATRLKLRHPGQLHSRLQQVVRRRAQLKFLRSLLVSGSTLTAFILGCWLGYADAPAEQTTAIASPDGDSKANATPTPRANTVQAALETIPVVLHNKAISAPDSSATLLFAGDVTLSDAFADLVGQDYDWAFAEMDEYRQADIAMVNLENPLTRASEPLPDKQFNFKADPDAIQVLTQGGVDIVTLANNHAMDYQASGLFETMETLDQAGIHYIGAGRDIAEARRPEIMEVKGQRIAFLGYYDADFHAAGEGIPGTNPTHNDRIAEDIRAIRNQVDWIVVNYHWGEEKSSYPGDWQVKLAHFTIDQGADLVVGHHPHVLQGAEIYKGRPIAYSLGNFIFGGNSRSDYDTAVLKVSLNDKQMKVEFLPVEVRQYQPKVVSGDRATEILQHIHEISQDFEQPMQASMILNAQPQAISPQEVPTPTPSTTPQPFSTSPENSFINSPNSTRIDSKNLRLEDIDWRSVPQPEPAPNSSSQPQKQSMTISPEPTSTTNPASKTSVMPESPEAGLAKTENSTRQTNARTCDVAENQNLEPWWKCYIKAQNPFEQVETEPSELLETAPWAFAVM
jgi:poly-gamma-glutamate capsule biosynthesis protein CapA/YwtB (metallophosphatase superfamily)